MKNLIFPFSEFKTKLLLVIFFFFIGFIMIFPLLDYFLGVAALVIFLKFFFHFTKFIYSVGNLFTTICVLRVFSESVHLAIMPLAFIKPSLFPHLLQQVSFIVEFPFEASEALLLTSKILAFIPIPSFIFFFPKPNLFTILPITLVLVSSFHKNSKSIPLSGIL